MLFLNFAWLNYYHVLSIYYCFKFSIQKILEIEKPWVIFFWKEDSNLIYWEILCIKCAAWIVEQGLFFIFCSRILVNVIAGGTQASSSSEFN